MHLTLSQLILFLCSIGSSYCVADTSTPTVGSYTYQWDGVTYEKPVYLYEPVTAPVGLAIWSPGGCVGKDNQWLGRGLADRGWEVAEPVVDAPDIVGANPTLNPIITSVAIQSYLDSRASVPDYVVVVGFSCGARALELIQEHESVDAIIALDALPTSIEPQEYAASCTLWPVQTFGTPRAPAWGMSSDTCQEYVDQWTCGRDCKLIGTEYWGQYGQDARVDVLGDSTHAYFSADAAPEFVQDLVIKGVTSFKFFDERGYSPKTWLNYMGRAAAPYISTFWNSGSID